MQLNIYAIYDDAVGSYGRPFFLASNGEALRTFMDMAGDGESMIGRHPKDYTLFHLGMYSDDDAHFDLLPTPNRIGAAHEFMPKEDN